MDFKIFNINILRTVHKIVFRNGSSIIGAFPAGSYRNFKIKETKGQSPKLILFWGFHLGQFFCVAFAPLLGTLKRHKPVVNDTTQSSQHGDAKSIKVEYSLYLKLSITTIVILTLSHKISHKCQFLWIEIYSIHHLKAE